MVQYPGIAAGSFLETVSGFSEPSWGFLEAVPGHPAELLGAISGRACEERGMASAGHCSGAVPASNCDDEAFSCCICSILGSVFEQFLGPRWEP